MIDRKNPLYAMTAMQQQRYPKYRAFTHSKYTHSGAYVEWPRPGRVRCIAYDLSVLWEIDFDYESYAKLYDRTVQISPLYALAIVAEHNKD